MSASYCLQVIHLEDFQWGSSRLPDLYVKVKLGDLSRKTSTIKTSTSPKWNEPLIFACDSVDPLAVFNVQLKRSSWTTNACVGATDISPTDLLTRCADGEASLDLVAPNNSEKASAGRIVVRLRVIGEVEAASIIVNEMSESVRRSKIMRMEGASDVTQSMDNSIARVNAQGDLYHAIGELLSRFDIIKQVIDQLSEIHPFLTIAVKLVSGLYTAVKGVFDTDKRVVSLAHAIADAFSFAQEVQAIPEKAVRLQQSLVALLKQTIECCLFIRQYMRRKFFRRMLDTSSNKKIDEFERSLGELKQAIESGVNLSTAFVSMRSSRRIDEIVLKQRLEPTLSYSDDRSQCLSGTRVAVREQILSWIFSDDARNIFWLHGVAGSGKSTISMTIVEHLRKMSRLGAFLFFEREKSQPSSVIKSIAYQLAVFDTSIGEAVLSETDKDSAIATASSSRQFDKLIRTPMSSATDLLSGPVVIVLDGFDECGSPETRRSLIDLIRKEAPNLPSTFRFLVTSRREFDVDKFLSCQPRNVLSFELDYGSLTSREDVLIYIRTEMHTAVRDVVEVPSDWPWDENMALLGRAAGGLFIWASTAVKMVKNSDNPFDDLKCLVSGSQSLAGNGLDQLYAVVLRGSGIAWEKKKSRDRFVKVMSLLLVSKVLLTTKAIDGLLGFPPQETSLLVLSRLRSVLTSTPAGPVSLFHASFADYLMSPVCRDDPWFIDTSSAKQSVVGKCFTVMEDLLRFNICEVKTSFSRNDDDPELADRIVARIPFHLEYACLYWPQHLIDVRCSGNVVAQLSKFAHHRLLFWFEVLSLKKLFSRNVVWTLDDVASWVAAHDEGLSAFFQDASKIANIFALPITESVAHIYMSMIPLSQDESKVSAHYSKWLRSMVAVERKGVKPTAVCLKTLTGHSGWVTSVSVSPDGNCVASSSYDGTIRVWDVHTGKETLQPRIKHPFVKSVSYFPDNRRIVSGAEDSTVIVWDIDNGNIVLGPLNGHTSWVTSVAVSRDGSMIASGSSDNTVIIWDASNGRIMLHLTGHTRGVASVAFSPDGTRLASASVDKTVRIWNVQTGEQVVAPFVHDDSVRSVAFAPNGTNLVTGSHNEVAIWDSEEGNIISVFRKHTGFVTSVGYSPCGTRIVSGSCDRTILVLDAVSSGEIVSGPLEGHTDFVKCIMFSRDGKYIISCSYDKTIRIWDATASTINSRQERRIEPVPSVNSVAIFVDASRIACASGSSIIIWDALRGDIVIGPLLCREGYMMFTPDNLRLVSLSWGDDIWIWDIETGDLRTLAHCNTSCIVVSPDGSFVVTGCRDRSVTVWDIATGAVIAGPLHGHSERVDSVAYSCDGKRLASVSEDKIIVWNTGNWEAVSELRWRRNKDIIRPCFSPDLSLLAFCTWAGGVLVCDVMTGQAIGDPFKEHSAHVSSVAFLPDGLRIALGYGDGTIRVWDVESKDIIRTFEGHSQRVSCLAASADGTRLVSGSEDGTVRVWDVSGLGTAGDCELSASLSSYKGDVSDWVLCDDGWIRGGHRQSNLLLWIPPDFRFTLLRPRNTLILNCEFSTVVDFTGAVIGERWSECLRQ